MSVFAKDPASAVDYAVDWTDWLNDGEEITSTIWDVVPLEAGGLMVGAESALGSVRSVLASAGVPGNVYRLSCTISTTAGRTVARGMTIRLLER